MTYQPKDFWSLGGHVWYQTETYEVSAHCADSTLLGQPGYLHCDGAHEQDGVVMLFKRETRQE